MPDIKKVIVSIGIFLLFGSSSAWAEGEVQCSEFQGSPVTCKDGSVKEIEVVDADNGICREICSISDDEHGPWQNIVSFEDRDGAPPTCRGFVGSPVTCAGESRKFFEAVDPERSVCREVCYGRSNPDSRELASAKSSSSGLSIKAVGVYENGSLSKGLILPDKSYAGSKLNIGEDTNVSVGQNQDPTPNENTSEDKNIVLDKPYVVCTTNDKISDEDVKIAGGVSSGICSEKENKALVVGESTEDLALAQLALEQVVGKKKALAMMKRKIRTTREGEKVKFSADDFNFEDAYRPKGMFNPSSSGSGHHDGVGRKPASTGSFGGPGVGR